ncbi:MAG: OmpA family protein [Bacteroidales bacterium]|nr:OmpA family protein [Bacteroidales bacterium]
MSMRHLLAVFIVGACCLMGWAQDTDDLSLFDNINTPEVPKKAVLPIQAHIEQIRQSLAKHYQDVELVRNDDVVMVTIPANDLFAPNSTTLRDGGKRYLRPFVNLLRYPTMYKVLVAVHTDNTGDEQYCDELSAARANAIDAFLTQELGTIAEGLTPYGIGQDEPIVPNNSVTNRGKNRRVEIYIVPAKGMIETARSGKLK